MSGKRGVLAGTGILSLVFGGLVAVGPTVEEMVRGSKEDIEQKVHNDCKTILVEHASDQIHGDNFHMVIPKGQFDSCKENLLVVREWGNQIGRHTSTGGKGLLALSLPLLGSALYLKRKEGNESANPPPPAHEPTA